MTYPRLDLVATPASARDLVVLAHGGQEHSLEEPHDWRHAVLRMWPFASAAHRAAPEAQVGLVRYRFRGWNGEHAHAAADVRHLLASVPEHIERIVLVGHSMGGRAVLASVDEPRVVAALGLAPWLPIDEPVRPMRERHVVVGYGDGDRMVDARLTADFVRRARGAGAAVAELEAAGETHALLHRYGDWEELVRRFVRSSLGPGDDEDLDKATTTDPDHAPDPLPEWSRRRGVLGAVGSIVSARLRLRPR